MRRLALDPKGVLFFSLAVSNLTISVLAFSGVHLTTTDGWVGLIVGVVCFPLAL